MNHDKIIELKIGHYRFMIGTMVIVLIALISGCISSYRSNNIDFALIIGIMLFYAFMIVLIYYLMKLFQIMKGLQ